MTRAPKSQHEITTFKATVPAHWFHLKTHREQFTEDTQKRCANEIKRPQIACHALSLRFSVVAITSNVRCQHHHSCLAVVSFCFCWIFFLWIISSVFLPCNKLPIIELPFRTCALFLRKSVLFCVYCWRIVVIFMAFLSFFFLTVVSVSVHFFSLPLFPSIAILVFTLSLYYYNKYYIWNDDQ